LKSFIHEAKLQYPRSLLEKSKSDPHVFYDLWSGVDDIIGRSKSKEGAANVDLSPDLLKLTSLALLLSLMSINQLLTILLLHVPSLILFCINPC